MHLLIYGINLSHYNIVSPTVRRITGKIKRKVVEIKGDTHFKIFPFVSLKTDRHIPADIYVFISVQYSCRPDVANIFFGDLPPENCQSLLGDTGTCIVQSDIAKPGIVPGPADISFFSSPIHAHMISISS